MSPQAVRSKEIMPMLTDYLIITGAQSYGDRIQAK